MNVQRITRALQLRDQIRFRTWCFVLLNTVAMFVKHVNNAMYLPEVPKTHLSGRILPGGAEVISDTYSAWLILLYKSLHESLLESGSRLSLPKRQSRFFGQWKPQCTCRRSFAYCITHAHVISQPLSRNVTHFNPAFFLLLLSKSTFSYLHS